ncbi:MAG: ParB N-terminal domain-containing protein [Chromatiaceae bacterium]|nr:ParB N-terminal domain-containing protein [Chromatiaceae bacterium]
MKKTPATPEGMTSAATSASDSASTITIPVSKAGHYIITLPIASIQIGNRFRQDHGDLDALAASIKELGLLQPIGVDKEHRLIFGERRLRAHQYLGLETIQARIIAVDSLMAEHAENEVRKDFTASERVAIAVAIEEKIGKRQGQRNDKAPARGLQENFPEVGATPSERQTRAIAARASGFGNETTYLQAKSVVTHAEPELVAAMDRGDIAVSTAAQLAKAEPEVQQEAASQPNTASKLAKEAAPKKTTHPSTAKLMGNILAGLPLLNAGQTMIVLRDALAVLEKRPAQLSTSDAATIAGNLRRALTWLVARFPKLADEKGGENA